MDLKFALAFILALSVASAGLDDYVKVIDTKDMGSGMSLWHSIGYNCTEQAFYVRYTNATAPQQDVSAYLFYLEYDYQLIDTGKTDYNGYVKLNMIGKQSLLNKVFVLRAEKQGFRTSEVQFTINCSAKSSGPAPQNTTPPVQNNTINNTNSTQNVLPPEENTTPPAENKSNLTSAEEVNQATHNLETQANRSLAKGELPCMGAFLLPLFGILAFRFRK